MPKHPKYKIKPDAEDGGVLRIFLLAGNGHVLFKSVDSFVKRGNAERGLDRIRGAVVDAKLETDD